MSGTDARARERIRGSLDESLLVEAAAGTGKTTMLVSRLVEVLATGRADIAGVVAVTFTNKAAGELKLRLRERLDRARADEVDPTRRGNLGTAIARLEEATIGTIHSFCAWLLRERPVEAGIDPAFGEMDEVQAATLFARAFDAWAQRRLDAMPDGLSRALGRLVASPTYDDAPPLDRLRDEAWRLADWRDYPQAWSRRPFAREAAIDELVQQNAAIADLHAGNPDSADPLRQALAPAHRLQEWVRRSEEVAPRDYDALEARLLETLRELRREVRRKGHGSWPVPGISRAEVARRRDALIEATDAFLTQADAELAALLQRDLREVVEDYDRLKRSTGQLDFLDLLIRARDMIRDCRQVRVHLQKRITHLFIDEFQDTDPLQVEILLMLVSDDPDAGEWRQTRPVPGKLFAVGDPKQSIYRFRRADVVLYEQVKQQLAAANVPTLTLSRSWRSVQPIQKTVNAAFAAEMQGDAHRGQPAYVVLEHVRESIAGQPSVVALPVPRPYGPWGRITKWQVEEQQPDVVAAWIDWLLRESGWQVSDPTLSEDRVPVQARHVAILFRRFLAWRRDVTRPYLAALEARGIPHLLSGGRSFHQREEVETVRAALTAVEWPDDELSVFATLKGSLFAVGDEALLRFREEIGSLHPFRRLPDDLPDALRPVGAALRLLAEFHRHRNQRPIARTITELLERTRAHAAFAMRPAGNQVLANVQRICDLARAFEVRGGLSFRGFVQNLSDEAARPGSTESPVLEEGAEGVRMMTVHGAKGMEFPVVILADITAQLARAEPGMAVNAETRCSAMRLLGCSPWELVEAAELEHARDIDEGVRLAYVAATRARDVLVVPAVGDHAWDDGWLSPLNRALYPPRERYRRSAAAPGCPVFGERSVLERPQRAFDEMESSVRPGLHESEAGEDVVWWDPAVLQLGKQPGFGLRQKDLLLEGTAAGEASAAAYAAWSRRRERLLERGAEPSIRVIAVSETESPPQGSEAEIEVVQVESGAERPGGRRFGTLVHTALRDVGAATADVEGVVHVHGRTLGATHEEMAAAVDAVTTAREHPLLRAAAAAPHCLRETPFTLRLDDGSVAEGVIDLVFGDGVEWTIVDFKTGSDRAVLLERYRPQALWYASAVERLLGGRARVVLLQV